MTRACAKEHERQGGEQDTTMCAKDATMSAKDATMCAKRVTNRVREGRDHEH